MTVSGFTRADARLVRRAARAVLALLDCGALRLAMRAEGPAGMARLNHRFRGRQGPADVLTFPSPGAAPGEPAGDVVLCPPLIRRRAAVLAVAPQRWLATLAVHGCLHALGFHHGDPGADAQMSALQRAALRSL